jgi:hypothetical protein
VRKSLKALFVVLGVFSGLGTAFAQQAETKSTPGMTAPKGPLKSATGVPQYLYTQFYAIGSGGNETSCGYAQFDCIQTFCQGQFGARAYRNGVGCFQQGAVWFCDFACSGPRDVQ